ncbi:MAG: CheR family methyltransferase [Sphingomonadales bacterium]
MEVSDSSSRILAALLEARTGQQLTMSRRWRIETALKSLMRDRGIATLDQLIATLVTGREPALVDEVVEALLNNETYFFRDRATFDLLINGALRRLEKARAKERKLAIWCAGCATGQEVYSLAMSFAEDRARWQDWKIDILGTDVSRSAIEKAREGLYSQFEVQRGLSVLQMMRWFKEEPGTQWRISSAIRDSVRFQVHSLCEAAPHPGRFDAILCRNVLLYFAADTRRAGFAKLAASAAPDGCLMLGAAETVIGHTDEFIPDVEHRGLYMRAPAALGDDLRTAATPAN